VAIDAELPFVLRNPDSRRRRRSATARTRSIMSRSSCRRARAEAAAARFARRLEEIERLPRRDQEALLRTIDAFLTKAL
jgi:hypothetical protein